MIQVLGTEFRIQALAAPSTIGFWNKVLQKITVELT